MFKVVNGKRVEMTAEEIAARQAEEQKWIDGPTAEELAAMLEAARDAILARFDQPTSIDKVLLKIAFLQENRIRALEGKQPITAQQFKDWVRSQID